MLELYKDVLLELFARVQSIQDHPMEKVEECYTLQLLLAEKIIELELLIGEAKNKISELKKQQIVRQTKEKSRIIKDEIKDYFEFKDDMSVLLHIFKSVGDSIAFTYIERWDIKPMGFKQDSGYLSGKKGF